MLKICNICNVEKHIDEFGKRKSNKDGKKLACSKCTYEKYMNKKKTKEGLTSLMYSGMRTHAKYRNMELPNFKLDAFRKWIYDQERFEFIYSEWLRSDCKKDLIPSVDRIDDYISYQFDNMQLMTWKENRLKQAKHVISGVDKRTYIKIIQYDLNGDFVKIYDSVASASRENNITLSSIRDSLYIRHRQIRAGNFQWKIYTDDYKKKIDKYIEDDFRIVRYDVNDNIISVIKSIAHVNRELGINKNTLRRCIRGYKDNIKGYKYKKFTDLTEEELTKVNVYLESQL